MFKGDWLSQSHELNINVIVKNKLLLVFKLGQKYWWTEKIFEGQMILISFSLLKLPDGCFY